MNQIEDKPNILHFTKNHIVYIHNRTISITGLPYLVTASFFLFFLLGNSNGRSLEEIGFPCFNTTNLFIDMVVHPL